MNLLQFRKKYPQYGDMTDEQIAKGIHKRYYPDLDFGDFSKRIGYTLGAAQETPMDETEKMQRMTPEPRAPAGQMAPGNIDLLNRPQVTNPDGSISTVRSMGIGVPGAEAVIPTIGPGGENWTPDQAIDNFRSTGQNFGLFKDIPSADAYAQQLHEQQARQIQPPVSSGAMDYLAAENPTAPAPAGVNLGSPMDIVETAKRQGSLAAKSFNEATAGFMDRLDKMATKVSEITGMEKGGLFEAAKNRYLANAETWNKRAGQYGLTDEIVGEIIGSAVPGVIEFSMGPLYSGATGYAEGGVKEGAKQAVERAVLGKILHAVNTLKILPRTLAGAAVGATEAAARGEDKRGIAKSAAALGLFSASAIGGKKTGIKEAGQEFSESIKPPDIETVPRGTIGETTLRPPEIMTGKPEFLGGEEVSGKIPEMPEIGPDTPAFFGGKRTMPDVPRPREYPTTPKRVAKRLNDPRKLIRHVLDITENNSEYDYDRLKIDAWKYSDKAINDASDISNPEMSRKLVFLSRAMKRWAITPEADRDAIRSILKSEQGAQQNLREQRDKRSPEQMLGEKSVAPTEYPTTPKRVIDRLVDEADLKPGESVLDPTAGTGEVAQSIKLKEPGVSIATMEIDPDLRARLSEQGQNVKGSDFLKDQGTYDKIVLTPPFENDFAHVEHAVDRLNPGGKAVALISDQTAQSDNFKTWASSVGANVKPVRLPGFPYDGNIVTIEKPKMSEPGMAPEEGQTTPPRSESYEASNVIKPPTQAVATERQAPQEIETGRRHSAIIKKMEDAFQAPVRVGKFRTDRGRRLGIYKPYEKVIRVISANDIGTIVHENAHHIQDILGWPRNHSFAKEVRDMAYEGAKNINREGFAEFVREYVTDEQSAKSKAPTFYKEFEEKLSKRPDFQNVIIEARQAYNDYKAAPSVSKVGSFVVRGKEGDKRRFPTMGKIYTEIKDSLYPVKKVVDIAKKQGGEIAFKDDPYIVSRLLRGWARKAEQFIKHRSFQYDESAPDGVEFTGDGLISILAPIERKGKTKQLDTYLFAKRALNDSRIQKGFDRILSVNDFKQTVKELEPEFKETAEKLYKYNDQLLSYLVDAGRIGEETAKGIRAKNLFYAPLYRLIEQEASGAQGLGRSANNVFNPIKKLKGSSRDIISPTENILKNTYAIINAAERNRLGNALMKLSKIEGMGKYIEKVPFPMRPTRILKEDIARLLSGIEGADRVSLESLPENIIANFRPQYRAGANEAIFYKNGKPQLYQLDPELYKAISSVNGSEINLLIKVLSYPAKWLRVGATTFSPEFGIRNPMRDQMTAWIQSKYGFTPGIDFLRGSYHILKADDVWQKFNASGAAHAAIVSMDRNYLSKNLRRMLREKKFKGLVLNPLELFQKFSELTEEASRVAEFAKAIKKEDGGLEGLFKGGMAGREVSLDFARTGGPGARAANMISAFWNARLEGLDKMSRTFKEQPIKAASKAFLGITLPSVMLWWLQKDDPVYQELPSWRKTLFWNWVFHRENKDPFVLSLPKPFEYGLVFGSMPEAALDWAYRDNPAMFKETAKSVAKTFDLVPIPTIAIPIGEWWAEKSWFFDRPTVPRDREDLEPVLQYGQRTSETVKLVARAMDKVPGLREIASPSKIENLIQGLTASMGRTGLQGMDWLLKTTGVIDVPEEPAATVSDMPGIRAVFARYPSANTQSIERFYDKYNDLKRGFESGKERAGIRGAGIKGTGFGSVYPKEEATAKTLSLLRKMAKKTYEADIDGAEKTKLLNNYYVAMMNAARLYFNLKPYTE